MPGTENVLTYKEYLGIGNILVFRQEIIAEEKLGNYQNLNNRI